MRRYFSGLVLLVLLFSASESFSQAFSPFSRYGLGYLSSDVYSVTRSMGGIATGYSSPIHINHTNPASYADIAVTTFEIGVNVDAASIRTKDSVYNGVNGTVNHVALGIPLIKNKWGLSFGLLPYSFLNYNFSNTDVDTAKVYTGKGSLYQLYIGTAYKIKDFSIGINGGYVFGKLDYTRGFAFTDSIDAYNVQNATSIKAGGFIYNVGLQYKKRVLKKSPQNTLKGDIFITAGVQGSSSVKINSRTSSQWERYINLSDIPTVIDTPLNYAEQKGKITIPYNFSVGLTAGNENWWIVGVDFKYAGWSHFGYDLNSQPLADSWRLMIGGGIVPNYDSKKFFDRIQYKAGGYYGKSEVIYQGIQLSEYGGTVGLSVPVVFGGLYREAARFHFSADLGSRTPGGKNLFSENYYRFNFGFTLNNVWFQKRKFD
ncbi:MAG: hypothetical protein JWO03_113 [Bacteroidetes bacterium]|nr:hypothetical protein [Bacteroidota bacterium]